MISYLLSSTAFLSDLVEEGHRLPNVGFDILGKLAFVAENLCGVHTSDYECEAFLLVPSLKDSQLRPRMMEFTVQHQLRTFTLPISRSPSSSTTSVAPPSSSFTLTAAAPLGLSSKTNETDWPTYGSLLPATDFLWKKALRWS